MKGTFFSKPLEWNIETTGESWKQGSQIQGTLKVKNHGTESVDLSTAGVGLAFCDIKKIQSRADGAFAPQSHVSFNQTVDAGKEIELPFSFDLDSNSPISDKKNSFYLGYGENFYGSTLQVKVEPQELYSQVVGLLDTFHRFKVKEIKTAKKGVEYKFAPPVSREMANLDGLLLTFTMQGEELQLLFQFQVKKLDTASVTTKVSKETVKVERLLLPKEYSLGRGMINQDKLLKTLEEVIGQVKLKSVF